MQVSKAIEKLKNEETILVDDKSFEPSSIESLKLDTGETMYWVRNGGDTWLSLDPASDEVILFNEVETEMDAAEDTVVYAGEDFEFAYAGEGKLFEDEEELDKILFRDYEGRDGAVIRIAQYVVNGDVISSLGQKVPEEDLREL
jgi:hypothetical protein